MEWICEHFTVVVPCACALEPRRLGRSLAAHGNLLCCDWFAILLTLCQALRSTLGPTLHAWFCIRVRVARVHPWPCWGSLREQGGPARTDVIINWYVSTFCCFGRLLRCTLGPWKCDDDYLLERSTRAVSHIQPPTHSDSTQGVCAPSLHRVCMWRLPCPENGFVVVAGVVGCDPQTVHWSVHAAGAVAAERHVTGQCAALGGCSAAPWARGSVMMTTFWSVAHVLCRISNLLLILTPHMGCVRRRCPMYVCGGCHALRAGSLLLLV